MRNVRHWMEDDLPHTQTGMKDDEVETINDTMFVNMAADAVTGFEAYLPKCDAFAAFLEQRDGDGSVPGAS
jgi:hypothetical protein